MSCTETITISQLSVDTPLHTATYVPATGKILGTSHNYILEFNATTGALERSSKFISPAYGTMHIGWIGSNLAVAAWNDAYNASVQESLHVNKDIFFLSPVTLEAGVGIGLPTVALTAGATQWSFGPRQFVSINNVAYCLYPDDDFVGVARLDVASPARLLEDTNQGFWSEQIYTDGSYIYVADPSYPQIHYYDPTTLVEQDYVDTTPYVPISCEGVTSVNKIFAVCGDGNLLRVDSWGGTDFTVFNIGGSRKAMRLRYNPYDGLLYIPCAYTDCVVVFNPVAGTSSVVSGFESPIDIVFTPDKIWAVQSSVTGLKEVA